ncbi:diguanylate cyclase [Sphingomonas sp. Leaf339]|uniref:putative bifunctional diguanylate cyclase/phosphodiesterase n=1 Tax=Sphingomonas sp. Leaf339 TaxID=1736343 RepID=UPI000701DA89|nr:EAL domain-containing protein [Sphingomonas sp. Leaf339]KQU62133.1 diguanylate cyclase [Sphingomonas sp. Leaf339]
MNDDHPSVTPPPAGISDLLALRERAGTAEWGRIRATQLFAGRRLALFMLAANIAGAIGTLWLLRPWIATWQLSLWAAITLTIAGVVAHRRHSTSHRQNGYASLADVRNTGLEGLALGFIWSVVPIVFCPQTTPGVDAGLGIIMAIMMTAAAFTMAPLVLATLGFLLVLGFALIGRLAFEHNFAASAGFSVFCILLVAICISRARGLVALRTAEIALGERDETVSLLLREFEEAGADWLWETDKGRRVVKASPRFAVACGLDPVTINGMPLLQVLAGPNWDNGQFANGLHELAARLNGREGFRDLRLPVYVRGEERWWELAAAPRHDERGVFAGFRGVGSDITEQRASADKINRMARYDALTGLPNRLLINETLGRAMAEAEKWGGRCAFMMIDLDRFKAVNDTLGHQIGDRVLSRVSERLAQMMESGTLCGRLGGDEFAVVVPDVKDEDALLHTAQRIIDTLSRPYEVDQQTFYIGASIGVAIGPRDGEDAETLIRSADLALYRSKDAGGGVVHAYEPQLHAQAEERRLLEMALRQALEKGEMHIAYQPVVDAETGNLSGFEALLRWQSKEFGAVSPVKFIPLAEEARLIAPIGAWVLRTACLEAARWPGHVRIAVNVSPDQLQNPHFVTTVASALANSGLSPERLELEVTESVFMHEGLGATKVLERVLDLGVRLSLDDFGTGYSSLGYLSRTRFSTIKIDRSFVQNASRGEREAVAIIRAVVALADSLGMATTAEGVETEAEHRMVQGFGCTKVQGYYFSRPLPVAEARILVQKRYNSHAA